jgi:competence protein ComEC
MFFPYIFQIIPNDKLVISFIDVGQGDSMLIQTPSRKTILVDGGGSETGSFDVGEKTLIPYLLDKGIMKIDYMMFSHFDRRPLSRLIKCYGKIECEKGDC